MWALAHRELIDRNLAREGSRVVVTCGVPFDQPGTTNLLKVETV
jgi:pyruvate kinase